MKRLHHFVVIDLRDRSVAEAIAALPLSQQVSALASYAASEWGRAHAASLDGAEEELSQRRG